jgi:hypothetical protein
MGTVLLFMKLDFISADHLVNDISALKCMAWKPQKLLVVPVYKLLQRGWTWQS